MEAGKERVANGAISAGKAAPDIHIVDLTENDDIESSRDQGSSDSEDCESDSFYEDLVGQAFEDGDAPTEFDLELCTEEEGKEYRRLLRTVGIDQFIIRTIEQGVKARKLCSAFFRPPPGLFRGRHDEAWYPVLGKLMERELRSRQKLSKYNTVDDAVALLKKAKNVMVITGAGISTSLGIPDFRSKHTGFYAQLAPLGLNDPQEVFDIEIFQNDPSIFYSIAKGILPSTKKFSPTHAFIRMLQDRNKLLTNYTQNIDNLEEAAGVVPDKLVQCHGSFATATCQQCGYNVRGEAIFDDMKAGQIPYCVECMRRLRVARPGGMKRKRSAIGLNSKKKRAEYEDSTDEDDDYGIPQAGVMKVSTIHA
jgi:NAD-dependent histone deacetylase SIR2